MYAFFFFFVFCFSLFVVSGSKLWGELPTCVLLLQHNTIHEICTGVSYRTTRALALPRGEYPEQTDKNLNLIKLNNSVDHKSGFRFVLHQLWDVRKDHAVLQWAVIMWLRWQVTRNTHSKWIAWERLSLLTVVGSLPFPLGSAEDEWMVSYFSFLWRLKHPQEAGGVDWIKERSVNNKLPGREMITIGVLNADLEKPRKSLLLPKMKKIYNKNVSRRYQDIKLLLYTPVYLIR